MVKYILQLIIIILYLYSTGYSQQKLFNAPNNKFFIVDYGNGVYIDSANNRVKIEGSYNWLYKAKTNKLGWLFGLGFNGVAYKGLQIIESENKIRNIDLVKHGLPSNYIDKLSVCENQLALLVNNKVYLSDYPYNSFKELNTECKNRIVDIQLHESLLSYITEDSIFIRNNTTNIFLKQILLVNKLYHTTIIGVLNGSILFYTEDSIYKLNIESNLCKEFRLPTDNNHIFYNGVFYFPSTYGTWFFDGESTGKIVGLKSNHIAFVGDSIYHIVSKQVKLYNISDSVDNCELFAVNKSEILGVEWEVSRRLKSKFHSKFISTRENNGIWSDYSYNLKNKSLLYQDIEIDEIKLFTPGRKHIIISNDIFEHQIVFKSNMLLIFASLLLIVMGFALPLFKPELFFLHFVFAVLFIGLLLLQYNGFIIQKMNILIVIWISSFVLFISLLHIRFRKNILLGLFFTDVKKFSHGSTGLRNIHRLIRMGYGTNHKASEYNDMYFQSLVQYCDQTSYQLINLLNNIPVGVHNIVPITYIRYLNFITKILSKQQLTHYSNRKSRTISMNLKSLDQTYNYVKENLYSSLKINPVLEIESVLRSYKPELERKNIKMNFIDHTHEQFNVLCKTTEFSKIIEILIENSIEAVNSNNGDKQIILTIKDELLKACISITDNGCGIPASIIDTLFSATTTSKPDGGFGLYWVKQTAEKFLGDIILVNTKKGATVFNLKLRIVK